MGEKRAVNKPHRIWAFVQKDFVESIKNKSIFIAVILPVIASLLFGFIDNAQTPKEFFIGIHDEVDSMFTQFVSETALNFELQKIYDEKYGQELVQTGQLDGLIVVKDNDRFQIYLDSQRPVYFFALRENITSLVEFYLNASPRYDLEFIPVGDASASRSVLPVWITITMSMIGVMVVSGMFAEEKDNKTLEAIGVSPIGYDELILGKGLFGVLLSTGTVAIMLILNRVLGLGFSSWLAIGSITTVGAVCFTAIGLLIGVLARSQSSARSIATMLYFPLLFPTLIAEFSSLTRILASFFPTFYVFRGLESILLHGQGISGILVELMILLLFSTILLGITRVAYRRRVNAHD